MICTGDDIGLWVAERVGGAWTGNQEIAIGLKVNGIIRAGCIFEKYIPDRSIVVHLAIERASKTFLLVCFRYGFQQLNINCAIAIVDSENHKSLSWVHKLGFKECGYIPDAGRDGDCIVMVFNRDDYERLEARYGKVIENA